MGVVDPLPASRAEVTGARGGETDLAARLDAVERPPNLRPFNVPRPVRVSASFGSGSGWTASGWDASTNLVDTTVPGLTGKSARLVTDGAGGVATLTLTGATSRALVKGQGVRLSLQMGGSGGTLAELAGMELRASDTGGLTAGRHFAWRLADTTTQALGQGQFRFGIAEYVVEHLSMADAVKTGTPDRTALTEWQLVASDRARGTKTTIFLSGIEVIPTSMAAFPNGVIVPTFDDGFAGPYTNGRAVLANHGALATFYPIADVVDGTSGSSITPVTVAQLRQLQALGHEVGMHAATKAVHDTYNTANLATIKADIIAAARWARRNGFQGRSFSYPQGVFNAVSGGPIDREVAPYYACARNAGSNPSGLFDTLPLSGQGRMRMRTIPEVGGNAGTSNTLTKFTEANGYLDRVQAEAALAVLLIHDLTSGPSAAALQCSASDLDAILAGAESRGVPIMSMAQVLAVMEGYDSTRALPAVAGVQAAGQINTSAVNIAPTVTGAGAAGASGLAADASHVHPTGAHDHSGAGQGGTLDLVGLGAAQQTRVDTFDVDTPGTTKTASWSKPTGAKTVEVLVWGDGGGGGAGRRTASGTVGAGGCSGAAGGFVRRRFNASDLPATVPLRVAGGGAGAAGQTTDSTNGANGTAGTYSAFGNGQAYELRAGGGAAGTGGTSTAGTAATGGTGINTGAQGAVGSIGAAAGASGGGAVETGSGGGAGGGIAATPANTAGGNGGSNVLLAQVAAAVAGTAGGGAGAAGAVPAMSTYGGFGGAGGGSNIAGPGGAGGDAGGVGAGGGGGGASLNGSLSGAGGRGTPGRIIVITQF